MHNNEINNSQVINRNRGVASCPESHKSQRLKALVTALPELIAYTHADNDANDGEDEPCNGDGGGDELDSENWAVMFFITFLLVLVLVDGTFVMNKIF